ncbi:minichromosome maintenance domain-containing protein 2-like isoform X2 [Rhopilema esculentum]|uniref:minichromosome maintenance domain-containing protein 2-like isoform X2 n=1 Tax=Rhopilema esculentum TaxID=499914 RepID=UPI0031DE8C79
MANIKVEPHSPLLPSQENFPGNSSGSNQCPSPASSELQTIMVAWVKKKLISKIKQFCDRFQAGFTEGIFYDFDMEIDVAELLESNVELGNFLIKDTKNFIFQLRWVIFKMISDKRWLNIEAASQILINPKFINLPTLSECMPTGRLPCIEGLMKIAGTVVGFTPIHEYTKGTKYNCTQEELCMSNACDNIFSWLPGIFEYDIVRPGRRCKQCYASMEEDVKFRKLAERRIFTIVLNDGIKCMQPYKKTTQSRQQGVTIVTRDDLVNRMKIGHDYWITGVVIREPMRRTASQQFYDTVLEACDIVEYAKMIAVKKNDCTEDLPDSIRSLYEDRIMSPWSFATSLAYSFGESICIGGSFHKLKLALLLSSVLSGNDLLVEDINGKLVIGNELQRINILCISDDVGKLQRLFTYASSVCDKAVLSQQNLDLFGSVTKKHEADTHVHIDGGSLLLAGKHLCVFPNLANLKKDEVSKLQKTLEEGSVSIDIPRRKANESEYIQMKFPLDCTLWALAESTKEQNEVAKNPWMQLADHFDLVYDLSKEYKLPDDIEKVQITEILREAVGYENHSEIKHNDLRTFAKIARTQRVTFSENASKMIRSFFLASRRARNTSLIGSEIGKKSLQTMLSIAAAHAKLSLRKEVTVDDAIIAITFYEECITIKTE